MRCQRCHGLMVRDACVDLRDDTGHLMIQGWRCVNCGEIIDPVVLTNRIDELSLPDQRKTRDRRSWERLVSV